MDASVASEHSSTDAQPCAMMRQAALVLTRQQAGGKTTEDRFWGERIAMKRVREALADAKDERAEVIAVH